jgi:hypothetical protein
LNFEAGGPANPGQGVNQGAALDAEGPTDCGLAGAAFERCRNGGKLLGVDCNGPTAVPAATTRSSETGLNPFLDQRPFELRQRPEDVKQELALRGRGVHLFGKRTEGDAACFQIGHCREEMGERSAEPIQLPDDQAIARPDESQRFGQSRPISTAAAGPILEQMPLVDNEF